MFITIEGIEGRGKTTQAGLLANYLEQQGYETILTREPGGTKISEIIRNIVLDERNGEMFPETELLLYLASRAQHTAELIKPALNEGYVVICDRYTDSTLAYQGGGRRLDMKTLFELTKFASYGLKPDVVFQLDITVSLAMERIAAKKHDRLEKESVDFYERTRKMFLEVANEDKERYIVINGNNDLDSVHPAIRESVVQKIKDGIL